MRRLLLATASCIALFSSSVGPASAEPVTLAIAAASTAGLGSAAASFSLFGASLSGFSAIAANFAVRAALGYALNALQSKPNQVSRGYSSNVNQLGPALPHQIIYGETKVGGAVVYQNVSSSGSNADRLHRVIAFAGHEIDSYQSIFLNDEEVTIDGSGNVTAPAEFSGNVRIKQYLGTDTQTADSDLTSEIGEWTSSHRLQGIAYLYVRFQNSSAFPNGVPNVSAIIKGKKVEDNRVTVTEGTPTDTFAQDDLITTTDYTRNQDFFLAVDLDVPVDPDGVVFEMGGSVIGTALVFSGDNLIYRAGDGASTPTTNTAIIQARSDNLLGRSVTIYCGVDVATDTISLWYGPQGSNKAYLLGTGTASAGFPTGNWVGGDNGGVGYSESLFPGGFNTDYNGTIDALRVYDNTSAPVSSIGTVWSDNPIMCLRDYLLSDFGLKESVTAIDEELFAIAANVCDEDVSGSNRYTCNGSFLLDASPEDIIRALLSSSGGIFWNYEGRWAVQAAEYLEPTISLNQDDLRSKVNIATRHSRRDNFNEVVGQYKGAETDYQEDNYSPVSGSIYLSQDNGVRATSELNLLFTDTEVMAQRIARTYLRRNRQQITVNASFGLRAVGLRIGDNVKLSIDHLGWTDKVFEVVDWRIGTTDMQIEVQMLLREMSSDVFEGITGTLVNESLDTLLDQSGNILEAIVN